MYVYMYTYIYMADLGLPAHTHSYMHVHNAIHMYEKIRYLLPNTLLSSPRAEPFTLQRLTRFTMAAFLTYTEKCRHVQNQISGTFIYDV